jgi:hypothetical protein
MEPVVLVLGLTAISLAITALFDVLISPMSAWRKAGWTLLLIALPIVGPMLRFRGDGSRKKGS